MLRVSRGGGNLVSCPGYHWPANVQQFFCSDVQRQPLLIISNGRKREGAEMSLKPRFLLRKLGSKRPHFWAQLDLFCQT